MEGGRQERWRQTMENGGKKGEYNMNTEIKRETE